MNKINIYFDETNHSRKISISKSKDKLTYDQNKESWFLFIFLGVNNEKTFIDKFCELENKYFKLNKNKDSGEVKSNSLLSKVENWENLKVNNKLFYIELLELVNEYKRVIQIGGINKINEIVRKWLTYIYYKVSEKYPLFFENENFVIFISKYINNNCQFEFLEFVNVESNVKKQLIFLNDMLKRTIETIYRKKLMGMEDTFNPVNGIISWLIDVVDEDMIFKFDFHWNYSFLNYSIKSITSELKVDSFKVIIDNEKNIFQTMKKYYDDVEVADSVRSPMIRVCDHIVGLFRTISNIVNKAHRATRKIDDNLKKVTDYPNSIFDIDIKSKELITQFWGLFNGSYWETFTNELSEEYLSTIYYIELMSNNDRVTSEMLRQRIVLKLHDRNKQPKHNGRNL